MKINHKVKLGIIIAVEFIAVTVILLLVFFAGKKTYKVTFDLNGGTLISGDLEQTVRQGNSATPPRAVKEGCYLHSWSASYKVITRDIVIEAVWEWETTVGLNFTSEEDSNYCEILSCFKDLTGDVYVGVYHGEKKILGIRDGAFSNCDSIENIYMLDGIISIGDRVFEGCDSLVNVQLPESLVNLGEDAFKDCRSLETVIIPEGVKTISKGTFSGCESLREVYIPSTVTKIEEGAFEGCTSLTEIVIPATVAVIESGAFDQSLLVVHTPLHENEVPAGWAPDSFGAGVVFNWGYVLPEENDDSNKSR